MEKIWTPSSQHNTQLRIRESCLNMYNIYDFHFSFTTLNHIFFKHIISTHTYTHLHECSDCLTIIHTQLSFDLILYIYMMCSLEVLDFLHFTCGPLNHNKEFFFTSFVFHLVTERLSWESTHKPHGPHKQHWTKRRKLASFSIIWIQRLLLSDVRMLAWLVCGDGDWTKWRLGSRGRTGVSNTEFPGRADHHYCMGAIVSHADI